MADRAPKGADRQVFIGNYRIKWNPVCILKSPLEYGLRNLKTNEVVIPVGCVAILSHLRHIETKLRTNVGLWIVGISDLLAELSAQLWKFQSHGLIDNGMSDI